MKNFSKYGSPVVVAFVIVIAVFCVCECLDFIRRGLFTFTVDRHAGRLFERVWRIFSIDAEKWQKTKCQTDRKYSG